MKTYYVLYNPNAGNGRGKERAEELTLLFDDEEA
jgi:diacylglycerol kinase family enzyme